MPAATSRPTVEGPTSTTVLAGPASVLSIAGPSSQPVVAGTQSRATVETPSGGYPYSAAVTVLGSVTDLTGLSDGTTSSGHTVDYLPIAGWGFEPGTAAYGCAVSDGYVYVGSLTSTGNSFSGSYVDATAHVFDPYLLDFTELVLETDLGHTGVTGSDGFGRGDMTGFCVLADGTVVGMVAVDYSDWRISTNGRYPVWVTFDRDRIDYDRSYTVDELKAASPTLGATAWPATVNGYGETYAANLGMFDQAVLPNGWVAVVQYVAPSGKYSGQLLVIDPTQTVPTLVGVYQFPDMTATDGTLLYWGPKFVWADPTSSLTDMRVTVSADVFIRGGTTAQPFAVMELAVNGSGTITPVTAPVLSIGDDTAAFTSYQGTAGTAPFDTSGNVWMTTGSLSGFGFTQRPLGCFLKTAGERSWTAQNPASGSWWLTVGSVRTVPDFELGVTEVSSQAPSGDYEGTCRAVVGFGGDVFPYTPDTPLAVRTSVLSNSLFAANITGWASFGVTGTVVWDSGDSGRLKMTGNGTSTSVIWQTDSSGVYSALPADSEGQSFWPWARVKAAATARRARVSVQFVDANSVAVGSTIDGPWVTTNTSTYVKVTCACAVPVGATQYKLFVTVNRESGGNIPNGEIHYSDEAYAALAPVTHSTTADVNLSSLPVSPADVRWPAGAGTDGCVDGENAAWVPVRCKANTTQTAAMPQYLIRLDLTQLGA